MIGIPQKNLDVLLKYLGDLHRHPREQVMLFKPWLVDDVCVQVQYLQNIGLKKAQTSGSKQKE